MPKKSKYTDRQRLDWLQDNTAHVLFESEDEFSLPTAKVKVPSGERLVDYIDWAEGEDYREAIDAAMKRKSTRPSTTGTGMGEK